MASEFSTEFENEMKEMARRTDIHAANRIKAANENRLASKLDKLGSPRGAIVTFEQIEIAIADTKIRIRVQNNETMNQFRTRASRKRETIVAMTTARNDRNEQHRANRVNRQYNEKLVLYYSAAMPWREEERIQPPRLVARASAIANDHQQRFQGDYNEVWVRQGAAKVYYDCAWVGKTNNNGKEDDKNDAGAEAAGSKAYRTPQTLVALTLTKAKEQQQYVLGDYNGVLLSHGAVKVYYDCAWVGKMKDEAKGDKENDAGAEGEGRGGKLVVVGSEIDL